MISLLAVMQNGSAVETATVSQEGAAGAIAAFAPRIPARSPCTASYPPRRAPSDKAGHDEQSEARPALDAGPTLIPRGLEYYARTVSLRAR